MDRQNGFSFSGFMTAAVVVILLTIPVFKLVPPYIEYNAIKTDMNEIVNDPDMASASGPEIRSAFAKKAIVDGIKSVTAEDLDIDRDPLRLHVKYHVKVPMVANFGVYFDFDIVAARHSK